MSENLLAVIVGGVFTLLGGAGVALMTAWLERKRVTESNARDRRAAQLAHAIEVNDAGRDWGTELLSSMVILGSDMPIDDIADLDAWKDVAATTRYRRAIRASDLVFSDPSVRAIAGRLLDHLSAQHEVMEPLAMSKLNGVKASPEQAQAALDFKKKHDALLDEFVTTASKLLD